MEPEFHERIHSNLNSHLIKIDVTKLRKDSGAS